MPTDEEKLLAILNQPDAKIESNDEVGVLTAEAPVQEETKERSLLDSLQRTTLQGLLESDMPSPEEIIRDAKIAENNAAVEQKRQERRDRRNARQAKPPKPPKRRRRR